LIFDLIGATYSIIAAGTAASAWLPMILPLSLAVVSYAFYQKKLKLGNEAASYRNREIILQGSVVLQ
jgi:hypothetical protein